MANLLKPTMYAQSIYTINYENLRSNNIKYLLFDLDNTLVEVKTKEPSNELINLFTKLSKQGFKFFIISNALKKRLKPFARTLNIKTYHLSCKPLKRRYKQIIKENNLQINEIAAIGDQLYTDILGANKMNITSILVDQLSSQESFLTKLNRLRENKLINKTNILKRGEYYE